MKLKFPFIFLLLMLIQTFSYSQKKHTSPLTGNWESIALSNSRGLLMKFNPDSTFTFQVVLAADYSYKIIGNKMITKYTNDNSGKIFIDTSTIEIKKDTLISTFKRNGKDEITTMIKTSGKNNSNKSIAGSYTWKYPNGHTAFSKFTKEGKWIFRLPIQSTKGKYLIKDSLVTFNYANSDTLIDKKKFWVKKNILILTDAKSGKEDMYKRVDYFMDEKY
ncbi:MAG: hypothetical protein M1480_14440 [Bacteroidetes bacterium]|nr:hypothetical protein [Bacteroidota bacterium]